MEKKKVSIIVPVYKVEKYLPECLDSICAQTYSNLQIICVNDGSPDGCGAILDKYAENDGRFEVVHQENAGVSASRNKAMSLADGDYVMFVDGDDWIDEDTVERTVQYAEENNLDICSFSYISEHSAHCHLKRSLFDENKVMDAGGTCRMAVRIIGPLGGELEQPLLLDSYGSVCNKVYNREFLDGLSFVDLNIIGSAEDSLFNMFAYKKARRTGHLNEYFYHYRKTNAGRQTCGFRPWLAERWKTQYEIIASHFTGDEEKKALQNRIAINVFGLTGNLMGSAHPYREIRKILKEEPFVSALSQLDTKYMKQPWRLFFWSQKHQSAVAAIMFHKTVSVAQRIIRLMDKVAL